MLTSFLLAARFASTPLLRFINPCFVLIAYGTMCTVFSLMASVTGGKAGLGALFLIFWGESVIYPTIFTLATSYLGRHTKRGAGILCMGVGGGAFFPSAQGALADAKGTKISYIVPMIGFSACVLFLHLPTNASWC
jgi:FHS family L-fucose permease-like MFS transporter